MARKDADKGKKLNAAARRVKVLELRKSGASIRAIAEHLKAEGYDTKASRTTVHRDLQDSLKLLKEKELVEADDLRNIELERIDALWLAHWSLGLKGNIASTWILIALSKRRSELIGLDAPKKHEITDPQQALAKLLGVQPEQLPKKQD